MTHSASETPSSPVRLELSLVGDAQSLSDLRFVARYVATDEVRIFHRMISERYPDELRLVFTDEAGAKTTVDRIAMSLPVATRVRAEDFVTVRPGEPVTFEFPVWGQPQLAPGAYTVVAEHVGSIGSYTTESGDQEDARALTDRIVSNPVSYDHE